MILPALTVAILVFILMIMLAGHKDSIRELTEIIHSMKVKENKAIQASQQLLEMNKALEETIISQKEYIDELELLVEDKIKTITELEETLDDIFEKPDDI